MQKILIEGKNKLYGKVKIGGMKNSALPIIYATILIKDECIIKNVPRVSDVENSLKILRNMGATAEFIDEGVVLINTKDLLPNIEDKSLVSKMRASSYLMGALLSRFKEASIPFPGGCNFGSRPIEQHLKGFEALGAKCSITNEIIEIDGKNALKSNKITLDKISVGATINMILASVCLRGVTFIENVAIEPHVDDLIFFLNKAGAKIMRYGRKIYIIGVSTLSKVRHKIYPDMIEALTYITFLGASKGKIELANVIPEHLSYSIEIFKEMGFIFAINNDKIVIEAPSILNGASVETNPYPLFPTDLHPQLAALMCFTVNGGQIIENIFKNRFAYINELRKMGAKITQENNYVRVFPSKLIGASLDATDLRAGAALITAALGANGKTEINNVNYIVRGYEELVPKLSAIGGNIKII